MKYIADFHVHSRFSRATSRAADLEHLNLWGKRKGITVVGTGDFTHPAWLAELKERLQPAEEGLYTLKEAFSNTLVNEFVPAGAPDVRFILTVEISSIYKKNGRVRKVHNLIFAPNLEVAEKFAKRLDKIGNIKSDGRPILGLDSKDLLEITLECSDEAYLVPAHIWTPHFSMLGARSGFDSMEECFEDLTDRIFAVETGLSSDPPMNWRISNLDKVVLISNSDAHSPAKLGREANLFNTELSYSGMRRAMEKKDRKAFPGTIEFFPEEGKYHYDGHRNCKQRMSPDETDKAEGLCPVCGKPVTKGVMYRVHELADRQLGTKRDGGGEFCNLIPLQEILGEILGVGPNSKKVMAAYWNCLEKLGPELGILKDLSLSRVPMAGIPLLPEALQRMRRGDVQLFAGYDGEFGRFNLFRQGERERLAAKAQKTLF
ncbi:MAG: endonuclease Q family protein [Planctomycetota bacterium]